MKRFFRDTNPEQPHAPRPTTSFRGPVNVQINNFILYKYAQRPLPSEISAVNLSPEPRHRVGLTLVFEGILVAQNLEY